MIDFDTNIYYYDKKAAYKVEGFIENLICHVKGELAGQKIKLEKWQKEDIIRPVFGIKRKKDGLRKYRTVYVEIPRKNAKSTLGAAIALYLLVGDKEPGAEVYSAAGDRDQAAIIFGIARGMVEQEQELTKRCKPFQHSITYKPHTGLTRFYKVISAEAKTKHGFNAHGIIMDELHTQPNRELWDVLTTSTGSRRQPLTFAITTAGYDKDSICYEIHEYANKIKDGIIQDKTFLPVLYSAGMEDDIYSEQTWRRANPGYGSIVKSEYIQEQANKIRNQPSFESTFRRLHLNQWVGTAETWIPDEVWMRGEGAPVLEGDCFGGLDLANVRDVAAFVLYFPGSQSTACWFWVPEEVVDDRSRKEGINYRTWVDAGLIRTTPGNAIDHRIIKQDIQEISEKYDIKGIAFDRWGAVEIVRDLLEEGFPMDQFGQGYASMSAPTKELEKMIVSGELQHGGNPVLRWMVSNVMIEEDPAANIKINKKKSREKVDGIVALVMAIGESMTVEPVKRSRYEDNPEFDTIQL
jgi:phage terminase large subunit-like protein